MLNVVILSVIMLKVVILSVVAPQLEPSMINMQVKYIMLPANLE
jgi:hypothetical protein